MASDAASETLTLLEERLRRLELLLRGGDLENTSNGSSDDDSRPAAARLGNIEKRLADLCAHSGPVAELLQLHSRLPELSREESDSGDDVPVASKLSIVMASSATISNTSSQLNAVHDSPLLPATPLAELGSLQSRLDHLRVRQEEQVNLIDQVRHRTSSLLENWYGESILRHGEQWVDWEQRLARIEQAVRRREAAQRLEQGAV